MTYPAFQKIARFNRETVVTEKIDGTNGLVAIYDDTELWREHGMPEVLDRWGDVLVCAGSRNRWLGIADDNFGFAAWVAEHSHELKDMGPGLHFGEWYGSGIGRGYGLPKGERRFMLFNTERWAENLDRPECCEVSTVLWRGMANDLDVPGLIDMLRDKGSQHVPGFMRAEGVIIYHSASRALFKTTVVKDEEWKGRQP